MAKLQGLTVSDAVVASTREPKPCRAPLCPEIASTVDNALTMTPPEYLSIVGPQRSGRTTTLDQLRDHFDHKRERLKWLTVDASDLAHSSDPMAVLLGLINRLKIELQNIGGKVEPSTSVIDGRIPTTSIEALWDQLEKLLNDIDVARPNFTKIVVLENLDQIQNYVLIDLFRFLRHFKSHRSQKKLLKTTILGTSTSSLSQTYESVVSPFNSTYEIRLSDHTETSHRHFLDLVVKYNKASIDSDAADLIFQATRGFLLYTQQVLKHCELPDSRHIDSNVIMDAMLSFLNAYPRFWAGILAQIGDRQHGILRELLEGKKFIRSAADSFLHTSFGSRFITDENGILRSRCPLQAWQMTPSLLRLPNLNLDDTMRLLCQVPMVLLLVRKLRYVKMTADALEHQLSSSVDGRLIVFMYNRYAGIFGCPTMDLRQICELILKMRPLFPESFFS